MEPKFTKYIWQHTSRQQIWILCVVLLSMIPYYMAFDLPKQIVNGPIQGGGFELPDAVKAFFPISLPIPFYGSVELFGGIELARLPTLMALSFAFLGLVIINGLFKYYVNTYKGLLGERLLRRVRFDLVDRILRFQPHHFNHIKGGEISSMVKDEVEPLGGFTADAFVAPAFLGGQALTALVFIFVQQFWLGFVALAVAVLQIGIIPKLRARLIVLGRQRQLGARQLGGRVTEIVNGINTIHANDTSNYERADIVNRLGSLFNIRYEIYQRKFMVKFMNNFLAQMTPFLFYTIGGYLAIVGKLDVGQLLAVIAAYKELPGPLKELIDWDLARQDVQVKYEQVVEQFDIDNMIDPEIHTLDSSNEHRLNDPLKAVSLTIEDDSGAKTLEQLSLEMHPGESVAVVGDANSGANSVAEVLGRVSWPTAGKLNAGENDIFDLPESITGRRITYASADTYFFSGTLRDNLLYGLKNAPQEIIDYQGDAAISQSRNQLEAERSGNPNLDYNSNWIDATMVSGGTEAGGITGAIKSVLEAVDLSGDIFDFALLSNMNVKQNPDFATDIVALRQEFREELSSRGLEKLVVPFNPDTYNPEARVIDNLLFGILNDDRSSLRTGKTAEYFHKVVEEAGLSEDLFNVGLKATEDTLEMFQFIPKTHPFFARIDYLVSAEIPRYQALFLRTSETTFDKVSAEDKKALINLSLQYIEPKYRFGLLDDSLMHKIVAARKTVASDMPTEMKEKIEFYDPEKFLEGGNLIDNIVFGKVNNRYNDAEGQVGDIIEGLLQNKPDIWEQIFTLGLDYDVGPGGRRLSLSQRQKLNFARALIRNSDYYVFNRPIAGLDQHLQESIVQKTLEFLGGREDAPGIIWVLASPEYAKYFNRRILFEGKAVREDKKNPTNTGNPANITPAEA